MPFVAPILLKSPLPSGSNIRVSQAPGGAFSHSAELYYGWNFTLTSGSPLGLDVLAVAQGTVVFVEESVPDGGATSGSYGDDTTPRDPSLGPAGALGNVVTLEHNIDGQTFYSSYFHLAQNSVFPEVGDTVLAGQVIGEVGNTGVRTDTHLHVNIGDTFGDYTDDSGNDFPAYQIAEGADDGGILLGLIDFTDSPNADGQFNLYDTFVSSTEPPPSLATTNDVAQNIRDAATLANLAYSDNPENFDDWIILSRTDLGLTQSGPVPV